jgi:predicted metal-dependent TIM-barrel fold hydrolase
VDLLDVFGSDRLWMNSACDWGESVPLAIPRTALEMRRRGWPADSIDRVIYGNPVRFLSQCPRFTLR